mgnify:CR=1 FL=1
MKCEDCKFWKPHEKTGIGACGVVLPSWLTEFVTRVHGMPNVRRAFNLNTFQDDGCDLGQPKEKS